MDGCSHSDIDSDFSEACILAARMLGVCCLFVFCLFLRQRCPNFGVKRVQKKLAKLIMHQKNAQ